MTERFPELLTTRSGEMIRTAEDFECFKKPELKALFSAFEYGEVPKRQLTGFDITAVETLSYTKKRPCSSIARVSALKQGFTCLLHKNSLFRHLYRS